MLLLGMLSGKRVFGCANADGGYGIARANSARKKASSSALNTAARG